MRLLDYIFVTIALLMFGAAAAHAETTHIEASFVAESSTPAPGKPLTIALAMVPEKGWHGYWQNPGDAGIETRVNWVLPRGVTASSLAYPVPQRLTIAGLMNYVFEGPYAHLITLTLPPGLAVGTKLPIRAEVDWLACTDTICVPEKDGLTLDLVVGDGGIAPANRARFDAWRAALPKPLGSEAKFALEKGRVRIGIPLPENVALADPYFYPLTRDAVAYGEPQMVSRRGDLLIVNAEAGSLPGNVVEGVLAIGPGDGLAVRAVPGSVPANGVPAGETGRSSGSTGLGTLLATFGAALLGGALLNIMPCVFPILSLKALSLVRSGESERDARREALAYTVGVILICLLLGGVLLLLRAGGETLGWAFQLQDPRVILMLMLLVTGIGFNLAGLFELPVLADGGGLAQRGGVTGAFWTGALAAFIATPCTGPFMAGALGAALVLPQVAAMAIFFGLGLGLALPFLLLGYVPPLRRMLPRPGAWMGAFRKILSLPMFLTGIGLAWILGRQTGVDAMAAGLLALLVLAVGLWWTGRRQEGGRRAVWVPAVITLGIAIGVSVAMPDSAPRSVAMSGKPGPEPFSAQRLATLRAEGRPVFVYFTADWCLTCKVNEKAAIERTEVGEAFEKAGVAMLVGDWTRGDPAIGRFLAAHGRSGVPLYLFYPAGSDQPKELPQLLTPSMMLALL